MLRIVCPACKFIFLRVQPVEDDGVTCPRCGVLFQPDEEELLDPEDD